MRRNLIGVASFVLAVSLFAGTSAIAAEPLPSSEGSASIMPLDETCASGHVCVWTMANFQGAKGESLCTGGGHPLAGPKFSLKNRCANKKVTTSPTVVCVNPGNNANTTFDFEEIIIGVEGSRC